MKDTQTSAPPDLTDADAWTRYLAEKPLPTRHSSLERLRKEVASHSSTLMSVTPIVKSDPVLCLLAIRAAQQLHAAKGSDVTSIDHAIGSLGLDRLGQLARQSQGLRLHPSRVAQLQYFRAIANSHHAATQCAQWLRTRHATYAEKGWAAALCYGVGIWSLWMHAPLHMNRIQCRVAEDGLDPVQAEIETLGCTTQQISLGLARAWQLPPLVIAALDHDTSPSLRTLDKLHQRTLSEPGLSRDELKELSHLVQQHFFPVKLANWLTLTLNRQWSGTRVLRMYAIIADYLDRELAEVTSLIHGNCALSAQQYHVPGTLAPAAEMLMMPDSTLAAEPLGNREMELYRGRFPEPPPRKPLADTPDDSPSEQTPDLADATVFRQTLQRLRHGHAQHSRPAHILQALMQGLSRGLGLPQLALQVVQPSQHRLKTAQVIGIEDSDPLARFQLGLNESILLRQLCNRPACIWIDDSTRPRLLPLLPETLRLSLTERDGLLMSVFMRERPVAVIFAAGDRGTLTTFHRDRFRELCESASEALERMLTPPASQTL
ncbi:MAG: HDOD domain-containing protein [Oceanospirillaceae bacterium]|nr:HDOD domain-containing protein [Oceanospirillaceae bacterium]